MNKPPVFIYDDNFLSEKEINDIESIFESVYEWNYCNILHDVQDENNIKYFTSKPFEENSPEHIGTIFILNKMLEKHQVGQGRVKRIKFNMTAPHKKTIVGTPHVDDSENHLVFLYYVNDAFGDTLIYDDSDKIVHSVSPKRGAAILFDGSKHSWCTPHMGSMRQVINVNYILNL